MGRTFLMLLVLTLAACETTNSRDWTGGGSTPFKQAERSCLDLVATIGKEEDRREFFIGCMGSLGWSPKAGASIEI